MEVLTADPDQMGERSGGEDWKADSHTLGEGGRCRSQQADGPGAVV